MWREYGRVEIVADRVSPGWLIRAAQSQQHIRQAGNSPDYEYRYELVHVGTGRRARGYVDVVLHTVNL